jgi:molybdopterin molybdotransferase
VAEWSSPEMTTQAPSVAAHRDRVLASTAPLPPVTAPVADALGRTLADDVPATLAVPRFDHAAMDGYAVRAADVAEASADAPVRLPVVGVVAAGDAWSGAVDPGAAVRIMTGAPVPDGADTVVPFEWTDRGHTSVSVRCPATAGRHVRRTGEDVAAGAVALTAGTRLAPRHLGLLAAVGCGEVVVRPVPRVAVIATGAELVAGAHRLPDGAVPDSNSATLAAAVRLAGGEPVVLGPAPDDPAGFAGLAAWAAEGADLVVTTGGISAGDRDVVKAALGERDGMWFGSVAVKPGRPQGAGALEVEGRRVPVVCLPGTPVAAYCTFLLFAVPAIRALAGVGRHRRAGSTVVEVRGAPATSLETTAPLSAPIEPDAERTLVLPGTYDEHGRVTVLPGHAGHSQRLLAEAEVLLVVPPGERLAAGDRVDVVRLSPEE